AAGTVVEQPAPTVARTGRVTLRWNGGDPGIDVRRSHPFVTVQRLVGGSWRTAFTDDSYQDTTERTGRDVWTEIVQFTECDALGRYRIVVDGLADKGDGVKPYRVISNEFQLQAVALQPGTPTVDGETARVKARYPAPAAGSLLAVPRLVQTGSATLSVTPPGGTPQTVTAQPETGTGAFAATVPAGSQVELVSVRDACGNTA
ncbi:MAG TPA: neutral/alkaline non-lysosomal ceramidase C-terminal domain-containing protein, partial [Solirubrobacteraceae bacterium]|nr:neutral/alkaline non-lysosomal ceramidase C-terminal domain-containing protein [Solirubrobacteraceae bacterium]